MPNWRYSCALVTSFALTVLCPSDLQAKCRSANTLAAGDHVFDIDFGGRSRTFNVHVPSTYDGLTPVPLVFDLHGFSGDGPGQLSISGFVAVSNANNFIVVAPTGYMNSWNGDIAYGSAYEEGLDDVGLMKAIVEYMAGIANINRGKVYSTGLSNGAAMSNTLGCQAADTFAAVAPVADPLDIGIATCHPAQPISVLGFHGYSDEYVPYEGGEGSGPGLPEPFPSIPDTLEAWAKIMGCTGAPELIPFQGTNKCEIYRECDGKAQVGYCSLEGSHLLYSQSFDIADYAWKFFDGFSLALPDADADGIGDEDDNCVDIANADQADSNANCVGDACECSAQADCEDGLFCNGTESCASGVCGRGAAPCQAGQTCDESLRKCADASAKSDAGMTAGAGAGGAKGGTGGAAPSGASGTGGVAGSPVGTGGAGANAGASGSGSTDAQGPSETESGCGCHALGSAQGSPRPRSIAFVLLAIGVALLSRRSRPPRLR